MYQWKDDADAADDELVLFWEDALALAAAPLDRQDGADVVYTYIHIYICYIHKHYTYIFIYELVLFWEDALALRVNPSARASSQKRTSSYINMYI